MSKENVLKRQKITKKELLELLSEADTTDIYDNFTIKDKEFSLENLRKKTFKCGGLIFENCKITGITYGTGPFTLSKSQTLQFINCEIDELYVTCRIGSGGIERRTNVKLVGTKVGRLNIRGSIELLSLDSATIDIIELSIKNKKQTFVLSIDGDDDIPLNEFGGTQIKKSIWISSIENRRNVKIGGCHKNHLPIVTALFPGAPVSSITFH